ncbi:MAG: SDR family NAD(P)-dependent oxidoreductase [Planctomycetota bacterium]|jgi:NADP-dependent 3-hydroxy acid dehydrogenase YdfG
MATDTDLGGRVAVITGASAGIGEATARRLAALGMKLALGARRRDRLDALAGELRDAHGVEVLPAVLDVRDATSVDAFAAAVETFAAPGGVHLLVNNAGLARGVTRLPDATAGDEQDWAEMIEVNVMGLLRTTRRFLPGLVTRGGGHVVNLGSLAGIETYEGGAVYCATKSAVRVINRALRYELLGSGVRVTCINPGLVETEFSVVRLRDEDRASAVYAGMTPLRADEIARAIEWVATLPEFMNIEELNLQPTDQASAQRVHRRTADAP